MTIKQKLAAKKILENPSKPLGQVMREVGYSENSAIAPEKNLTSSKGWNKLMDNKLPDDKLLNVHVEGLEAMRTILSHTEPDRDVPDHPTRHKFLETAYKIKGKLRDVSVLQQFNTDEMNIEFVGGDK